MGIFGSHLCKLIQKRLNEIEKDCKWSQDVKAIKEEVNVVKELSKTDAYKPTHEDITQLKQDLDSFSKQLWQAQSNGNDERVKMYCTSIQVKKVTIEQRANQSIHNGMSYNEIQRSVKAAHLMSETLNTYIKSDKKPKGPCFYVFNKAIEIYDGVQFRAKFGGYDLTNGDCLKVMEVWNQICDAVCAVYPNGDHYEKIYDLMKRSKLVCQPSEDCKDHHDSRKASCCPKWGR